MYGREELEEIPMIGWECYDKEEADKVMDAMEQRIKELEEQCTKYQAELMNKDPALNDMPKWISVNDRLPNILEDVIIFYGNVFYCVTYYGEDECWGVCSNIIFHPNVITHWMPLPQPPTTDDSSVTEKEK